MLNRLIFFFSLFGLMVSAYLAYEYLQPTPIHCPLAGTGCETVRNSAYSKFFGLSIPYLGIFYYFVLGGLSIAHTTKATSQLLHKLQLVFTTAAFTFSLYLTYLEASLIHAYCFWCLISFMIASVIFALT